MLLLFVLRIMLELKEAKRCLFDSIYIVNWLFMILIHLLVSNIYLSLLSSLSSLSPISSPLLLIILYRFERQDLNNKLHSIFK